MTSFRLASAACITVLLLALGCSGRIDPPAAPPGPSGVDQNPRTGVVLLEDFTGRQVFPADNWWNLDVSHAPVDPTRRSIDWISGIDAATERRSIPTSVRRPTGSRTSAWPATQPLVPVTFVDYPERERRRRAGLAARLSDPGRSAATCPNYIEGGVPGGGDDGDRHLLIVDRDHWLLFETWATHWNARLCSGGRRARARCGTSRPTTGGPRDGPRPTPRGWRSSRDSCATTRRPAAEPIRHAFRFTTRATNGYVWPASHAAGDDPGRAADGRAPATEGRRRHLRLPAAGPPDLPGDEDLRPDPRRQRQRHVHHRARWTRAGTTTS